MIKSVLLFLMPSILFGYQIENNIYILDESNFKDAVKSLGPILIQFYIPNCPNCKIQTDQLSEAGVELARTQTIVGKIDVRANLNIGRQFNINTFPTYFLFQTDQKPILMSEKPTSAKSFVSFVIKTIKVNYLTVKSQEDLTRIVNENQLVMVYFSQSDQKEVDFKVFEEKAEIYNRDIVFVLVPKKELRQAYNLNELESIVLFTKYPGKERIIFKELISKNTLTDFIFQNSFPDIYSLDRRELKFLSSKSLPLLLLVVNQENTSEEQLFRTKYYGQFKDFIKFGVVHNETVQGAQSLEALNGLLKVDKSPLLAILDFRLKTPQTYKLQTDIKESNVQNFLSSWRKQTLVPEPQQLIRKERAIKKVEETVETTDTKNVDLVYPMNWNGPIDKYLAVIAPDQVDAEIKKQEQYILFFYTTANCDACKVIEKQVQQVGRFYSKYNGILIAKVESPEDEEKKEIKLGIQLFTRKDIIPMELTAEITRSKIVRFIRQNVKVHYKDEYRATLPPQPQKAPKATKQQKSEKKKDKMIDEYKKMKRILKQRKIKIDDL